MESDEYKKHCIVLTPESEDDIDSAKKELIQQGEDAFALNKSIIIRKALKNFVKTLRGEKK